MSLFGMFRKAVPHAKPKGKETEPEEQEEEEFTVVTLVPRKLPMTAELVRRQREEELRKKYCAGTLKRGM